jgi:hypothetical protein
MIETNKLIYTYNAEAINRDYQLIKLNSKEYGPDEKPKFIGYVDFYEALENTPGVAALVGKWRYWYLLADRKGVTPEEVIRTLSQHRDLQAMEIVPAQVVCEEEFASTKNKETSLYGYYVVQLLLDLLGYRHFGIKEYQFSNIASELLLVPKDTPAKSILDVWWIRLKKPQSLVISKTRLSRVKDRKYILNSTNPLFTINTATRTLKSISRSSALTLDKNTPLYEWRNPFDSRPVVPFADLEDPLSDQTRIGIFAEVFSLIEGELAPYVSVRRDPLGSWQMAHGLQVLKKTAPGRADSEKDYEGRAIKLIGSVTLTSEPKNEKAEEKLAALISAKGIRVAKKAKLGLAIVPSKESLAEDDEDPYERKRGVQHIMLDTLVGNGNKDSKELDSIITKMLFELAVKQDCMTNTLCFGKELALSEPYRLGLFVQKARKNRTQKNFPELLHIPVLDVFPDGAIKFQTLHHEASLLIQQPDFDRYADAFTQAVDEKFMEEAGYTSYQLIGFVENANKEITLFAQTDYCSLMNMDILRSRGEQLAKPLPAAWTTFAGIGKKLSDLKNETWENGVPHRANITHRDAAIAFFTLDHGAACAALAELESAKTKKNKSLPEKLKSWIAAFRQDPRALLDKDTLRTLLNAKFGAASQARDFVAEALEREGVLLNMPRSREAKQKELSFKSGLQVCPVTIGGKRARYYFTGFPIGAALKTTIARASVIRLAIPAGDHEPFFEELSPTFLPWIRVDEGTVLPGAFKYLREYALMEGVPLRDFL